MTYVETLASISSVLLGWAALREVRQTDSMSKSIIRYGNRLARIEGMLSNGIKTEVTVAARAAENSHAAVVSLREAFDAHADGEEDRIVETMKRRGY